jgi:SAM-dependent methyltransferase
VYLHLKEHLTKEQSLLDIGAGIGHFIMAFDIPNLYAIEMQVEACNELENKGIEIIGTDVYGGWFGQYDVILFRGVLEHLHNPFLALQKIRNGLNEGGMAYILVPDNFNIKLPFSDWLWELHQWYFNRYTLEVLLNKAGLFSIEMTSENNILYSVCMKCEPVSPYIEESWAIRQRRIFDQAIKNEKKIHVRIKKVLNYLTKLRNEHFNFLANDKGLFS